MSTKTATAKPQETGVEEFLSANPPQEPTPEPKKEAKAPPKAEGFTLNLNKPVLPFLPENPTKAQQSLMDKVKAAKTAKNGSKKVTLTKHETAELHKVATKALTTAKGGSATALRALVKWLDSKAA